jgi:hypothetical protein
LQIFNTPDGILSTEEGLYKAEVVQDKNRRGARGRFKMYDDDEDEVSVLCSKIYPSS